MYPESAKTSVKDARASDARADTVSTCSEPEMDYFYHFSRELLVAGIKACINERIDISVPTAGKPPVHLRPFRILISLLDRAEVGCSVLEDIMIDVFRCMYRECAVLSSSTVQYGESIHQIGRKKDGKTRREDRLMLVEVIKTANLLFGAFEPHYIWDFIGRTFEKACTDAGNNRKPMVVGEGDVSIIELCVLVDFLLDKVSLVSFYLRSILSICDFLLGCESESFDSFPWAILK